MAGLRQTLPFTLNFRLDFNSVAYLNSVDLVSMCETIDTGSPAGRLFFYCHRGNGDLGA
jgi:hypothetical protein